MHSANVFFPGKKIMLSTYHVLGVQGSGNTAWRIPGVVPASCLGGSGGAISSQILAGAGRKDH